MAEPDLDQYFYLLENPLRRRLLELLSREELYPLQMARELGISPTGIMKHLNLLEEAELVGSHSVPSPQGPPRKLYATTAGFAIRVAVGPNTFEQRIIRLTGDATLPQVRSGSQGMVRVPPQRPARQKVKLKFTRRDPVAGDVEEGEMEVLGPEEEPEDEPEDEYGPLTAEAAERGSSAAGSSLLGSSGPRDRGRDAVGDPGVRFAKGVNFEESAHEKLKQRIRVAVTEARHLDPRARLALFAHMMDEMEKALTENVQRHKELLEIKRLVQGEVGHMAHETGCTYDERKVLYCRLDHPTAPISRLAELTELREGIIRELEERLRHRHLLDRE